MWYNRFGRARGPRRGAPNVPVGGERWYGGVIGELLYNRRKSDLYVLVYFGAI